jgi:two-component system, cell cycle response regulator
MHIEPTDDEPANNAREATPRAHAYRVLIVDDHPDNVEVIRVRLEARGYRTTCASDGEEALRLVAESPPDLILLDVMMPHMDGNEVARRIKADETLPFIPIIMQTALDSTQSKVKGLSSGADGYITKPIDFAELEARVEAMLRIKTLEKKLTVANTRLTELSITDELTGLYNRRRLDGLLTEMFEHSLRLHEPLAVAMFDIDHFKRVNDTHGHPAGDRVLAQVARLLRNAVRDIDRLGRYGGEEFMVLLPGTVPDAAVTFAERVRQEVETHQFEFDDGVLSRTLSVGVAGWPYPRIHTQQQLVKAADQSLYVAKSLGRNCVIRFDGAEFNANVKDVDDQHENGTNAGGAARAD